MIVDTNNVCTYCGLYILFEVKILLTRVHLELIFAIKAAIIIEDDFDYCGYINNGSHFCKSYYGIIIKKKILKFESANCINILAYQKYPNVFTNLILVKKIFILALIQSSQS